jgi:hypothetical protein
MCLNENVCFDKYYIQRWGENESSCLKIPVTRSTWHISASIYNPNLTSSYKLESINKFYMVWSKNCC